MSGLWAGSGLSIALFLNGGKQTIAFDGEVASLVAAPSIQEPAVNGVASLSAVGEFEGLDSREAAAKVRAPLLVLAARGDATTDAGEVAPELAKVSPSKDKRVVLFNGSNHGIDLLEGENGPRARSLLRGFIDRNLPQD
jgi:pimeloyl-ACP methyl ester carboxylesterase